MLCVVAVPEGVGAIERRQPDVMIATAALDDGLDDRALIRPGLGDRL